MFLNKQIMFNSIKIVAAAIVAILLAMAANLQFEVSAGIVAILTIQPTKIETIKTAFARLIAFIFSLFVSFVFQDMGMCYAGIFCVFNHLYYLL